MTALCGCGCGEPTSIAKKTQARSGHIKGRPVRFIQGHATRGRRLAHDGPDYVVDEESGCWVWQRSTNSHGYGQRRIHDRIVMAHRLTYEEAYGPIPDGLEIDHRCENPSCVNPEHLEAVTHQENMRRAWHRGTDRGTLRYPVVADAVAG